MKPLHPTFACVRAKSLSSLRKETDELTAMLTAAVRKLKDRSPGKKSGPGKTGR